MNTSATLIAALVLTGALTGVIASPGAASASAWNRRHPARTDINGRLRLQNARITNERRSGEITASQAHALRADDRSIRLQERADAGADGHHGHLNRGQVGALNAELNANSRAIGK